MTFVSGAARLLPMKTNNLSVFQASSEKQTVESEMMSFSELVEVFGFGGEKTSLSIHVAL